MPNYFVINSKFKPYSFDELIKPYQMYAEQYDKQEALIEKAQEKAFAEQNLNRTRDTQAALMYDEAVNNLQAASDELATRGLSNNLRSNIRKTASDYRKTMEALTLAQAQMVAERDRRLKAGSDYVYQQDEIGLDDFLYGNTPNTSGESLDKIAKDIGSQFAAKAATLSNTTFDKIYGQDNKYTGYYDFKTSGGLTSTQIDTIVGATDDEWNTLVTNNQNLSSEEKSVLQGFRDIVTNKKESLGFDKYDTDIAKSKIEDAIYKGAQAGLYSEKHEYKNDHGYNPLGWQNRADQLAVLQAKYPYWDFTKNALKEGVTQEGGNWVQKDKDGNTIILGKVSGGSSNGSPNGLDQGVRVFDKDGKGIGMGKSIDEVLNDANERIGVPTDEVRTSTITGEYKTKGEGYNTKTVPTLTNANVKVIANELRIPINLDDESIKDENGNISPIIVDEVLQAARAAGYRITAKTKRDNFGNIKDQQVGFIQLHTTKTLDNNSGVQATKEEKFDPNAVPKEG